MNTKKNMKNNVHKKKTMRIKYGGSIKESQGFGDVVGSKISSGIASTTKYIADKTARVLGYEPVVKDTNSEIDNKMNAVSSKATDIIEGVNSTLSSPDANKSISEAAENTAEVVGNALGTFNDTLSNPEVMKEVEEATQTASKYAEIIGKSAGPLIDEGAAKLGEILEKEGPIISKSLVKMGVDAASAVPGVGAVIALGNELNDGSAIVSAVVEGTKEAVDTSVSLGNKLLTNIDAQTNNLPGIPSVPDINLKPNIPSEKDVKLITGGALKNLQQLQKAGSIINNRITQSIKEFESPKYYNSTKKRVSKNKILKKMKTKTKRKRF